MYASTRFLRTGLGTTRKRTRVTKFAYVCTHIWHEAGVRLWLWQADFEITCKLIESCHDISAQWKILLLRAHFCVLSKCKIFNHFFRKIRLPQTYVCTQSRLFLLYLNVELTIIKCKISQCSRNPSCRHYGWVQGDQIGWFFAYYVGDCFLWKFLKIVQIKITCDSEYFKKSLCYTFYH
jgi:hypothetical protein